MGLKKIWTNRFKIWEGIRNSIFKSDYVEKIAAHRMAICEENICGFYDKDGTSEKTVVRGKSACGQCGCESSLLIRCLSCECSLGHLGLTPLWPKEMTEEEEREFDAKKQ